MFLLALSASFEYLCYESVAIIRDFLIISMRDRTLCLLITTIVVFCFTSKAFVVDASWYGRCDFDVLNFLSETSVLRHSSLSD